MDEKIFQRIIPFIIAVIVLVVQYVIKNQKKKANAAQQQIPVPQSADVFSEEKPVEQVKKIIRKETVENVVKDKSQTDKGIKKTTFTTMKQNIKPKVVKTKIEEDNKSESISFDEKELKKAIIYSEIFTPKHF